MFITIIVMLYSWYFYFTTVSIPTVSISAINMHHYYYYYYYYYYHYHHYYYHHHFSDFTPTVGQPILLLCEVTTVRGITSRVYFVWSCGDLLYYDETSFTVNNSQVYTSIYYIPQVNTFDEGRVFQCEGIIQTIPPKSNTNTLTLDVTGQCILLCNFSV